MDKIRDFLREKGFLLVIVLCLAAAAAVGVWAIRSVRENPGSSRVQDGTSGADDAGLEPYPGLADDTEGTDTWDTGVDAAGRAENVPQSSAPSASSQPSAASRGSASSQRSGAAPSGSGDSAAAPAPAYTQPVSGSVTQAFSGDELVYSRTLGDWRTHNGTDYSCKSGEAVFAPASGTVQRVYADGNWGGVVELADADGRLWRLCGVTGAAVQQGDAVAAGQQLGTAGVIGCENADGTHIHLEVLQNGAWLDPASCLG